MSEFTCPKCGGHVWGRDTEAGANGQVKTLPTVQCHSDKNGRPLSLRGAGKPCDWRGEWPNEGTKS